MKRWLQLVSVLGLFFFTILAFVSYQITLPLIPPSSDRYRLKYYDYSGITHTHTVLSTGSGNLDTVALAARKAGCDFVILTDLNQMDRPIEDAEGYRNDVLVIWAGEYSFLSGHLLGYNLPKDLALTGVGQNQLIFNDWLSQKPRSIKDGFLVAAHPQLGHRRFDKLDWPGLNGMEVFNLESIWRSQLEKNKLSIFWSFLILPFNPDLAYLRLFAEPTTEIATWDNILKTRPFVGYAGSDSTANAIRFQERSLNFPSYTRSFRLMKNHVVLKSELTGLFEDDKQKIIQALGNGQFYFSIDIIGDPTGFSFFAWQGRQEYLMGQTMNRQKGPVRFVADLGRDLILPHEILLIRNGEVVERSNDSKLEWETKTPGAYRIVVRVIPTLPVPDGKRWFPWIYSNAIRLE